MIKQKFIPALILLGTMATGVSLWIVGELLQPVPEPFSPKGPEIATTPSPKPSPASPKPTKPKVQGLASYYSREGCIGCSGDLRTASGEPLDDNALTLAFNGLPMGTMVKITNTRNNKTIIAKVNDTGGFHKYNRIADLSLATKNAIDLRTDSDTIIIEVL